MTRPFGGRALLVPLLVTALLAAACTGDPAPTASASSAATGGGGFAATGSASAEASGSGGTASRGGTPVGPGSVSAPDVPPAPTIGLPPFARPAELAATLARQTAPGAAQAEQAWLRAYAYAGVPVLAADGTAVVGTEGDPVGPGWWEVWMLTAAQPVQGVRLTDALAVLISPEDRPPTTAEKESAARALLADLRAAATSDDPDARFTAAFLDAKARQAGTPTSLLAPDVDLQRAWLDQATVHLLSWITLRDLLASADTGPDGGRGTAVGVHVESAASRPLAAIRTQAPAATPCSQMWGSEQTTYVTNWLTGKVFGGANLPGLNVKGVIKAIQELNPHIVSDAQLGKFEKFAQRVNAVATVASILMQYASFTISGGSAENLQRTRTTTNGERVDNRIDLAMDPGHLPDGNDKTLCALSFLLNAAGISFNFPPEGPVSGVEVVITGEDGFGERVLFADMNQLKQDTGPDGSVPVSILGKAQKKELPEDTPQVQKEYTLSVEATPEPVDGNSLFNAAFDGLSFAAAPTPFSALALVLDIAKTFHWDLGEQVWPMTDWQPDQYRISGTEEGVSFTGLVCDLSKPFSARGAGKGVTVNLRFSPRSREAGSWSYTGGGGGISISGSGRYTVSVDADGTAGTIDMSGAGQAGGASKSWDNPLQLTGTDSGCER